VLKALMRRHRVEHALEWPRDRAATSAKMIGYSNADIEAVVLLANDRAHAVGSPVTVELFEQALYDYLPSRDANMLEYMELLAVFESSSREMLPKRYQAIDVDELQARLRVLRAQID
jgi:transitional endoplasmic reticulum ATPase